MNHPQPIEPSSLLMIANQLIQDHPNYLTGMRAFTVEERDHVLIFKGECFLDPQGMPTKQTPAAFNMFKYLAHQLSGQFSLLT